ncbi:hypothetical protein [Streptomyces reniochalinae]
MDVADTLEHAGSRHELPSIPNEAEALKARGFTLVRVQRPGNPGTLEHESETALDDFPVDRVLINGGTLFDLETEAHSLVKRR